MSEVFATTDDLVAGWRHLDADELGRAATLLRRASAILRATIPGIDARLDADPPTLDAEIPRLVVCAMVRRAMLAGLDAEGVSSTQQQAGPFMEQFSFANPTGALYLKKDELRLFGRRQRAFMIDTGPVVE